MLQRRAAIPDGTIPWNGLTLMDKHKGTHMINSHITADFHADYATLFVFLHKVNSVPLTGKTTPAINQHTTSIQIPVCLHGLSVFASVQGQSETESLSNGVGLCVVSMYGTLLRQEVWRNYADSLIFLGVSEALTTYSKKLRFCL